eukprot:1188224-Prorocentrum_minimum.AAC.1
MRDGKDIDYTSMLYYLHIEGKLQEPVVVGKLLAEWGGEGAVRAAGRVRGLGEPADPKDNPALMEKRRAEIQREKERRQKNETVTAGR